ncbi:hypothetical protein BFP72_05685 [Reichenbachiella sp. 5M10]|uniref:glycoside hydrolase family 97 protein n=1 Tax=Reichenbachiella sp. 5M10 TaxID=1889772 RepID=UPI000C15F98F|nr:glycoside hydrolase family 97 protein [Reichenbachiella sp. 5M10]PIB34921.1 hypothetical protein BFP72_05685 [Reichenbachiella sp. 5M10]
MKTVKQTLLIVFGLVMFLTSCDEEQKLQLASPNGNSEIVLSPASQVEGGLVNFSVLYKGRQVILPSSLQLLTEDLDFGSKVEISELGRVSVEEEWTTRFGELSQVPNRYSQASFRLKGERAEVLLTCRAYDEGVAFSYQIPKQNGLEDIAIDDELIHYRFEQDFPVWTTPEREPGKLTAQGEYSRVPLSELPYGAERPLVIEQDSQVVALAEARLVDFARLSFRADPAGGLSILSNLDGKMVRTVQDTVTGALKSQRLGHSKVKAHLPLQSPWRVVMLADDHGQLLEQNYLIQNLNPPSAIEDESWIEPGKVLRETTLTTQGAMAAIDFVADHQMQYVHFDAGWYGNEMKDSSDATTVTLDPKRSKGPFDMKAVTAYAKSKGIKVMLYVNRRSLERQLDELLPLFAKWGISGVKFGFVRVGDQQATAWLHEAIAKAAAYQMVVDVHDEYRPTGFSRTYPNLLTQEGIAGDETSVSNEHTLITMFTRMLAGAADNTVCYYNKRVETMGSHASQLAKTVCLFSPLQFLYWYDKPAASPEKLDGLWGDTKHIGNEPELAFFDQVPTTWDETKVLEAEIARLGVIARRKGGSWYIGGISGPEARAVNLDFSFLDRGQKYVAKLYTDDESIETRTHVKIEELELTAEDQLVLQLEANTGFAMSIELR